MTFCQKDGTICLIFLGGKMNCKKVYEYGRVYPFTNENLMEYSRIYDFKDKDVLSVVGSGDQYFSSLLFGAKSIQLFDINSTVNYLFALKFFSIRSLSYEEFKRFFVESKLDDIRLYNKIKKELPINVRKFFDYILLNGRKLSSLIFSVSLNSSIINYSSNRVVPYFEREIYYILQEILRKIPFPKIHNLSLKDLCFVLNESFDIMLFSNIFLYLNMDVKSYKHFLKNYLKFLKLSGVIQANYVWTKNEELFSEFISNGFVCDEISSIRITPEKTDFKDYVFSLKKAV